MAYFLLKTEPSVYSITDLESEKESVWDGVENALALKYIRTIEKGDQCFIYHTGKEKQIVGLAQASSGSFENYNNEKLAVFKLKFVECYVKPLSLAEMKADKTFEKFELLRLPRLSVMVVPDAIAKEILKRVNR
jgi:predicted RNA-binding protein with PUA-like domain